MSVNIIKKYLSASCSGIDTVMEPSWSYGSYIYNYLCNQCMSPLKFESSSWRGVLDATLCNKICQWQFSPVSSYNGTDCHDITEMWLKVALNTLALTLYRLYLEPLHTARNLLLQIFEVCLHQEQNVQTMIYYPELT